MRRIALSLATGVTVTLLALAVQQAAATQLSLSSTSFRATWSTFEVAAIDGTARCQLTLEGSFHASTLAKATESLVGYVTRASLGPCSQGTATVLTETLPWHRRYRSFTGVLPNITGMTTALVGFGIRARSPAGTTCTYRSTTAAPALATANVSAGTISSIALSGNLPSGAECFSTTGALAGTSALATVLNGTTRVNLTLVGAPPPPDPRVVTVGDSFMSGEGGRWAGNSSATDAEALLRIDRLGNTAYFDNGSNTAERIPLCHRSKSAEAYVGVVEPPWGENLACSGAKTRTFIREGVFKPGLDFYNGPEGRGQALMLKEYALAHPNAIKLVAISIGGNDFGFGDIIESCVRRYILTLGLCSQVAANAERIDAAHVAANTAAITAGILEVRRAMQEANYADNTYKLSVQDYPAPLPSVAGLRYAGYERTVDGGCPLYDADISWANNEVLPAVNGAVWAAVTATGLANVVRLELLPTFNGRRLCEVGVGSIQETGLESWMAPNAVDASEWISRIWITPPAPMMAQEMFHPNYWGEKAFRSCLRLVYNGGAPRGGTCQIAGSGKTAFEEPRMRLL